MDAFLLYILKSGICLTVFYVCFKALFSNDTFSGSTAGYYW